MKRITKKQAVAFCKDAAALIQSFGFQPMPGTDSLRAMTDLGTFIVHPPDPNIEAGSYCVDINGRFPDTSFMGEFGSPEYKHALYMGIGMSGKWNVLDSYPDYVLSEWKHRMEYVNARPPTPEESAVWAEQDRLDAEKWEKARLADEAWLATRSYRIVKRGKGTTEVAIPGPLAYRQACAAMRTLPPLDGAHYSIEDITLEN